MTHILLVEDYEVVIDVFRQIFEDSGYQLTVVTTAEEALPLAKSNQYDLVICDYCLPGMNGTAFCQCMAQLGLPESRFIMISGYPQAETGYVGANYFRKPFNLSVFLEAIDRLLAT